MIRCFYSMVLAQDAGSGYTYGRACTGDNRTRGGFALEQGQLPPKHRRFPPNCDIKHCMTNSKNQRIGAKRSVLWPSKYTKMRFLPRPKLRCGAYDGLPDHAVGWGKDIFPIPHPTRQLDLVGGYSPRNIWS